MIKKITFTLLFIVAFWFQVSANGILSYLQYKHLGGQTYTVKLYVVRDCRGLSITGTLNLDVRPLDASYTAIGTSKFTTALTRVSIVPMQGNRVCSPANTYATGSGFEIHTYTAIVKLDSVFTTQYNAGLVYGWNFSSNRCCIPGYVNNINSNQNYIESEVYIKTPSNVALPGNSSPDIDLVNNNMFMPPNGINRLNPLIADTVDAGDSLNYYMDAGLSNYKVALTYITPFSANIPVQTLCIPPTILNCTPNPNIPVPRGFYLDKRNGELIFVSTESGAVSLVTIRVDNYRKVGAGYFKLGSNLFSHIYISWNDLPQLKLTIPTKVQQVKLGDTMRVEVLSEARNTSQTGNKYSDTVKLSRYKPIGNSSLTKLNIGGLQDTSLYTWVPTASDIGKHSSHPIMANMSRMVTHVKNIETYVYKNVNQITVKFFNDKNANGIFDSGEPLLDNIGYYFTYMGTKTYNLSSISAAQKFEIPSHLNAGIEVLNSPFRKITTSTTVNVFAADTVHTQMVGINFGGNISGRLYVDVNKDCNYTPGIDIWASKQTIGVNGHSFGISNDSGNFTFKLDSTGTHAMQLNHDSNALFCNNSNMQNFTINSIVDENNLGLIPIHLLGDVQIHTNHYTSRLKGDSSNFEIKITNRAQQNLFTWTANTQHKLYVQLPTTAKFDYIGSGFVWDAAKQAYYKQLSNIAAMQVESVILKKLEFVNATVVPKDQSWIKVACEIAGDKNTFNNYQTFVLKIDAFGITENSQWITQDNTNKLDQAVWNYYVPFRSNTYAYNSVFFLSSIDPASITLQSSNASGEILIRSNILYINTVNGTKLAYNGNVLPNTIFNYSFGMYPTAIGGSSTAAINGTVETYNLPINNYITLAAKSIAIASYVSTVNLNKSTYCPGELATLNYKLKTSMPIENLKVQAEFGSTILDLKLFSHAFFADSGFVSFVIPKALAGENAVVFKLSNAEYAPLGYGQSSAVSINGLPIFTAVQNRSVICTNEKPKINLTGNSLFDLWQNNVQVANALSAGLFTVDNNKNTLVIATNNLGCKDSAIVQAASVDTSKVPVITISHSTPLCPGSNLQFDLQFADSAQLWINSSFHTNITKNIPYNYIASSAGTYNCFAYYTSAALCAYSSATKTALVGALPHSPNIERNGNLLQVSDTFAKYQWLYTTGGNAPGNSINHQYVPSIDSAYKVKVWAANGCSNFSNLYTVRFIGVNSIYTQAIQLYPQPASQVLLIASPFSITDVMVFNAIGQSIPCLFNNKSLDISKLSNGAYSIVLHTPMGLIRKQFIVAN